MIDIHTYIHMYKSVNRRGGPFVVFISFFINVHLSLSLDDHVDQCDESSPRGQVKRGFTALLLLLQIGAGDDEHFGNESQPRNGKTEWDFSRDEAFSLYVDWSVRTYKQLPFLNFSSGLV